MAILGWQDLANKLQNDCLTIELALAAGYRLVSQLQRKGVSMGDFQSQGVRRGQPRQH